MSNKYTREILRRNVAQMCQTIGWHSINSTPLDILTHVLEKYILTLGTQAHHYAEQFNRSDPNLHDLGLVFRDLHVQVPELADYVRSVPATPSTLQVEPFPKLKESHLNFLKPGSHEVVTRPVHVHEHLPAMYPDKEKEPSPIIPDALHIRQNGHTHLEQNDHSDSPEISVTDSPDKQRDLFKRPNDPVGLTNMKKPRLRLEDEDCHTREISSVMMTMSGFLSPAREGKLPEARTPVTVSDRHPNRSNHSQPGVSGLLPQMFSEKVDKKSKKSKILNGKVMKSKKKDKSHRADSGKLFGPDRKSEKSSSSRNKVPSSIPEPMPLATPSATALPTYPLSSVDSSVKQVKQESVNIIDERHGKSPITVLEPVPSPVLAPQTPPSLPPPCVLSPLPAPALTPTPPCEPYNNHVSLVKLNHSPVIENFDSEKLTSQPDRSKLNIFKKISSKPKEDRPTISDVLDKYQHINTLTKLEKVDRIQPPLVNKDTNTVIESTSKSKRQTELNHIESSAAMDLSYKHVDLTANEVINIDDDSLDYNFKLPHESPPPEDVVNSLANVFQKEVPINPKIKKERKKKTPQEKHEKILKEYSKLLKKQQMAEAQAAALRAEKMDFNAVQNKPPKGSRPHKTSSKHQLQQNFSQAYPFLPMQSIPRPRLIPNSSLVRGDLFMGLANNPALRGIIPPHSSGLLVNPFSSLPSGPGLIPGPSFLPHGPGLIPPGLPNPLLLAHSFGQPPRMSHTPSGLHPLLRRPSLEVIPVNHDQPDQKQLSPVRQSLAREKQDKMKMSSIPNILQKQKNRPLLKDIPKSNPVIKMPPIHPDITITELNTSPKSSTRVEPVDEFKNDPSPAPTPVSISPPASNGPSRASPLHERDKEKSEKKKEKIHKKDKKDKDLIKIKKKKEKKDKHKDKSEKKKDKEDKDKHLPKEKVKKEKKEKRKEKEKPFPADGVVPKLTLKLGSASPMTPNSPDVSFKLNIKPVIKREEEGSGDSTMSAKEVGLSPEPCRSPELATISALVTRPPKLKSGKQSAPTEMLADIGQSDSPPPQTSNHSPHRKNKTPSSFSKYKRISFKPIPKKGDQTDKIIIDSETEEEIQAPYVAPVERPAPLVKPAPVVRPAPVAPPASLPLAPGTPFYTDELGNKVWVCPGCGRPDNGTSMIGCDGCDGWYHWVCVGITVDPGDSEDWFCGPCVAKQHAMATALAGGARKRGRKPKHREH